MSRPKRVYPNQLHLYTKLHTRAIICRKNISITALHLIKETKFFYFSLSSWSCMCYDFKCKNTVQLEYNIPILSDIEAIKILERKTSKNFASNEDYIEAVNFLNNQFPNKKLKNFYDLNEIMYSYCSGRLIDYSDDGSVKQPHDFDLERRENLTAKYLDKSNITYPENVTNLLTKYKTDEIIEDYILYENARNQYIFDNFDLTPTLIEIAKNSIVCPYVFTRNVVEGSKYENAGDIYMIMTNDTIYFEIQRYY